MIRKLIPFLITGMVLVASPAMAANAGGGGAGGIDIVAMLWTGSTYIFSAAFAASILSIGLDIIARMFHQDHLHNMLGGIVSKAIPAAIASGPLAFFSHFGLQIAQGALLR